MVFPFMSYLKSLDIMPDPVTYILQPFVSREVWAV